MNPFVAVLLVHPGFPQVNVRNLDQESSQTPKESRPPALRPGHCPGDLVTGLAAEHLEARLGPPVGPLGVQGIMGQVSEVLPCDPGLVKRRKTK